MVNYSDLPYLMLQAIRELKAGNDSLREQTVVQVKEIEGLKSQLQLQNAAFQERLSRLESLVTTQMQTAVADKTTQPTTSAPGGVQ
jgi:hypothetical protein